MIRRLFRLLWVLWAGSLWSLALWVAPSLFSAQPDRHLAGVLAARLFGVETYVGLAVAVFGLILPGRTQLVWVYLAAALLGIDQWVIKPLMNTAHSHGAVAGLTFGAWHGISAVIYVAACIAAAVSVWNEDLR